VYSLGVGATAVEEAPPIFFEPDIDAAATVVAAVALDEMPPLLTGDEEMTRSVSTGPEVLVMAAGIVGVAG